MTSTGPGPAVPPPGSPPVAGPYPSATPPPSPQVQAPPGAQELKCSSCGAPIRPQGGLTLVTCEYCGTATSLGNAGWSVIQKHFMLENIMAQDQALQAGGKWLDQGVFRRKVAEKSELAESTLKYVPYWIIPTSVTADFTGQKGAGAINTRPQGGGEVASTIAKIGLQIAIGAGQRNQRQHVQPQVVRVRDRIQVFYNIPVVAVRGYTKYQPDDGYQFSIQNKVAFEKRKTGGIEVLNGDVTEQEAMQFAQSLGHKYAEKEAKKRVDVLESFVPYFQVSPGELLHAPVWFVRYRHKGKEMFILVDGNVSRVIDGERPTVSLW